MRDHGKILRFLHGSGTEHGPAGGARRHHVAVIAKDGKRLRRDRTRRDMKNGRRQLARDLVHVGDHEQQPLRSRKRGAERAGLQRAMNRAGGAAFALHLDDLGNGLPKIFHPARRPRVSPFSHRRSRRDRIDGDDFVERVSDSRDRFVGIQRPAVAFCSARDARGALLWKIRSDFLFFSQYFHRLISIPRSSSFIRESISRSFRKAMYLSCVLLCSYCARAKLSAFFFFGRGETWTRRGASFLCRTGWEIVEPLKKCTGFRKSCAVWLLPAWQDKQENNV